jgi:hypothetical protein
MDYVVCFLLGVSLLFLAFFFDRQDDGRRNKNRVAYK